MKRTSSIILLFITLLIAGLFGCNKDSNGIDNPSVVAERTTVKTYEIINLVVKGYTLKQEYSGTFGTVAAQLLKTSDSTLTFFIPEVANGSYELNFELSKINFNVTQTVVANPDNLVTDMFQQFDAEATALQPGTPEEVAERDSLIDFKQDVVTLFNSLEAEEKRQAILFYEANKAVFQSFSNNLYTNLDTTISLRQSQCPRTDGRSYYVCTAQNVGASAVDLANCSKQFITMMTLAGVAAYLAPASLGLSAFGSTLALGTAGYLLITEVRPAALKFKWDLKTFLHANWLFTQALFSVLKDNFVNNSSALLNLIPKFRPIQSTDTDVAPETGFFINAYSTLSGYWSRLSSLFGTIPAYQSTEITVVLNGGDVTVTILTNSANVQIVSQSGGQVTFKSLSGNTENFTYRVRVTKGGFIKEKEVSATVQGGDTVTDIDGNVYNVVKIGDQYWMKENLKTTRYKDGTAIPNVTDNTQWGNLTTGAYAIYDNNAANNTTYGKLYNWYAVNTGKLAPSGWHVPTDAEWTTLTTYLGGESIAGDKMKATTLWTPYTGITNTNSSGFTGLPAGYRSTNGAFLYIGSYGDFWSSPEYAADYAWSRHLHYDYSNADRGTNYKENGFSVRCVRD